MGEHDTTFARERLHQLESDVLSLKKAQLEMYESFKLATQDTISISKDTIRSHKTNKWLHALSLILITFTVIYFSVAVSSFHKQANQREKEWILFTQKMTERHAEILSEVSEEFASSIILSNEK